MNTLFNMNELFQTEQSRQFSDNSCNQEVSKITRPNLHGIARLKQAQRAMQIALASITAFYSGHANIINREAYNNGTAQVLAEIWEDGENVLYQFDINEDGDFTEIRLS